MSRDRKSAKRQEQLRQQRHVKKFGVPRPKPKRGKCTIRNLGKSDIPVTPYVPGSCPLLEKFGLVR